jgi:hypothetical protein
MVTRRQGQKRWTTLYIHSAALDYPSRRAPRDVVEPYGGTRGPALSGHRDFENGEHVDAREFVTRLLAKP